MQKLLQFPILQIQALRFRFNLLVILFTLLCLNTQVIQATELYRGKKPVPPAIVLVAAQTDNLLKQLSERKEEFTENPASLIAYAKDFALSHWDIAKTSRLILGPYWRKASKEQRELFKQEYLKTLLRYVIRAYGYYDERLLEVVEYDWKKQSQGGWVLSTVRIPGGAKVAVDYRMMQDKKSKQWRLIDVRAEGISLVYVKSGEYRKIAKRDGIDGLIKQIAEKNNEVLQPLMVAESE